MNEKSTSSLFNVVFDQDFYGEINHSTTMDLATIMPHMAAAMIAAGLGAHWDNYAIVMFFLPVLETNKALINSEDNPRKDLAASANALLLSVNAIGDYFNKEYDEDVNFRAQVVKMIERVIPARLGEL